jgi:hypothetical protein
LYTTASSFFLLVDFLLNFVLVKNPVVSLDCSDSSIRVYLIIEIITLRVRDYLVILWWWMFVIMESKQALVFGWICWILEVLNSNLQVLGSLLLRELLPKFL